MSYYTIRTGDIIWFDHCLNYVYRYSRLFPRRVTLVPLRQIIDSNTVVVSGMPYDARPSTVGDEATLQQNLELQKAA